MVSNQVDKTIRSGVIIKSLYCGWLSYRYDPVLCIWSSPVDMTIINIM